MWRTCLRKLRGNAKRRRRALNFREPTVEILESRFAPATASLNLPSSGFSAPGSGGVVMDYPVNSSALSSGLTAASIVISYPTGVFAFPVGSRLATADVSLGSIPLGASGGAASWNLAANSPTDGLLLISLSAKPGQAITGNIAAGSLVTVNFPVGPFNPSSSTNETIRIISASGVTHTQLAGYTLSPAPPYSGTITITPNTEQPPTITTPQTYSTDVNTTLSQPAPGLLAGASDQQGQPLAVTFLNGISYTPGTTITLPSGAMLTVLQDGSFVYVPEFNFVGQDSFTFNVSEPGGNFSATGTVTVTINPALAIATTTLPEGDVGAPYNQTIAATGGTGSLTFSATGTLPTGLSLSSVGVLSGTPTLAGSYTFTVTATDTIGASASQAFTVTINPALAITTTFLPGGTVGVLYNQTIMATGGSEPYTFNVTFGALPDGLTLSSSGVLSGTPTLPEPYSFTVTASDALGNQASRSYNVNISRPTVYVDPSFTGTGDPATDPGLGLTVGVNAFSTITAGLAHVPANGILVIFGGTYKEPPININVPLAFIELATNPSDAQVAPTVTIKAAVTLNATANFYPISVPTGTGASSAANLTFNSTVDGPADLWFFGPSYLTFNAPVGSSTALSALVVDVPSLGATLSTDANLVRTSGDQKYFTPLTVQAGTTTFDVGGSESFIESLQGGSDNAVVKDGAGILTLGAEFGSANTYTGLTTVNAGLLNLDEPGGAIPGDLQINSGGSVIDERSGQLSNGSRVTIAGSGSLTLAAGVSETIDKLTSSSSSSSLVLAAGSSLTVTQGKAKDFQGTISGPGTVTFEKSQDGIPLPPNTSPAPAASPAPASSTTPASAGTLDPGVGSGDVVIEPASPTFRVAAASQVQAATQAEGQQSTTASVTGQAVFFVSPPSTLKTVAQVLQAGATPIAHSSTVSPAAVILTRTKQLPATVFAGPAVDDLASTSRAVGFPALLHDIVLSDPLGIFAMLSDGTPSEHSGVILDAVFAIDSPSDEDNLADARDIDWT